MVKCRYCDDGKEFSYSVEFLEHEKECRESQGKIIAGNMVETNQLFVDSFPDQEYVYGIIEHINPDFNCAKLQTDTGIRYINIKYLREKTTPSISYNESTRSLIVAYPLDSTPEERDEMTSRLKLCFEIIGKDIQHLKRDLNPTEVNWIIGKRKPYISEKEQNLCH